MVKHLGGDVWSTDVALTLMQKEKNWRVMLLTLGGVDKIGHIWGEMDNPKAQKEAAKKPYNMKKILQIADAQVGRIISHLKENNLWEKTFFVLTADHGSLSALKHFYGDSTPDAALKNISAQCRFFNQMPGAIAVYRKTKEEGDWKYERCTDYRGRPFPAFLNPVPLLDTMAMEKSLRIPLLIHMPGKAAATSKRPVRLVDIMPILFDQLQIPTPGWMDGRKEKP